MYEAPSRTRHDDIAEARDLLQELFFQGTIGARVLKAQRALRKWGNNRVSEIFNGKARRIDGYELLLLRAMKAERLVQQLQDARKAHAEFNAETERLAAMFAHGDEAFHGPEIEARRGVAGGADRPGNQDGEAARLIRRGRG